MHSKSNGLIIKHMSIRYIIFAAVVMAFGVACHKEVVDNSQTTEENSGSQTGETQNEESGPIGSNVIVFQDAEVKKIIVSRFDTDKDGEISYAEAEAVESLGIEFYKNANIKTFDELRFFTGLKKLGEFAFAECKNLSSILLPENLLCTAREK